MRNKLSVLILAACLVTLGAGVSYANHCEHGGDKACSKSNKECASKGSAAESPCPITGKFLKKADFFLDNQKDLGLSEEQVKTIKSLVLDVKKSDIRAMADMQVFTLDVYEKMAESKVDVEAINAMVDKLTSDMAASTKATVANYAKLKAVLTDEQMAKAKEIWLKNQS